MDLNSRSTRNRMGPQLSRRALHSSSYIGFGRTPKPLYGIVGSVDLSIMFGFILIFADHQQTSSEQHCSPTFFKECSDSRTMAYTNVTQVCLLFILIHPPQTPCPDGFFMNILRNSCQPCTPAPEDYNAIEVNACNATHDAKYMCKERFFDSDGEEPLICQKCTPCEDLGLFVVKNCSAEQDAVCCTDEPASLQVERCLSTTATSSRDSTTFLNMTSAPNATIDTEKNLTITAVSGFTCSRNKRLDVSTNTCKPCDDCSYVDYDLHSQQACDLCSERKNHSNLVDCPTKCFEKENYAKRIVLSILCMILVPFCTIPFWVMYACWAGFNGGQAGATAPGLQKKLASAKENTKYLF